jgi:hypothetical protein
MTSLCEGSSSCLPCYYPCSYREHFQNEGSSSCLPYLTSVAIEKQKNVEHYTVIQSPTHYTYTHSSHICTNTQLQAHTLNMRTQSHNTDRTPCIVYFFLFIVSTNFLIIKNCRNSSRSLSK